MIHSLLILLTISQYDPNGPVYDQLSGLSGSMVVRCLATLPDEVAETEIEEYAPWVFHKTRVKVISSNWASPGEEKSIGYPQLQPFRPTLVPKIGKLYLVAFGIWTGGTVRVAGSSQIVKIPVGVDAFAPSKNNFYELPEGDYSINGPNVPAQLARILAKAYQISGEKKYLISLRTIAPTWTIRDDVVISSAPMGIEFIHDAVQFTTPVLITAAGAEPMKRLSALFTAVSLGDSARIPALKSQIAAVDSTWSDLNASADIDLTIINRKGTEDTYLVSLLGSRMATFRRSAILALFSPSHRAVVIARLSDSDAKTRAAAIAWLDRQDVPNKPVPRWNPDGTCSNETEIIEFWNSPPP